MEQLLSTRQKHGVMSSGTKWHSHYLQHPTLLGCTMDLVQAEVASKECARLSLLRLQLGKRVVLDLMRAPCLNLQWHAQASSSCWA